ncbi:MAG: hypothetical protein AAGI48_15115 [Verrucomicrobiota bacterium]
MATLASAHEYVVLANFSSDTSETEVYQHHAKFTWRSRFIGGNWGSYKTDRNYADMVGTIQGWIGSGFEMDSYETGVADGDGDGVPSLVEDALGTDPTDPADYPSDGTVGETSLSDTDGDGIPDFWEALMGTDQNDPASFPVDTDGDGAPDAFDPYSEDPSVGPDPLARSNYDNLDPDGDLDGDGVSNGDERNGLGDYDTDGDGIRDDDELWHGSDPTSPNSFLQDTDGDGFSNAVEDFFGTGPLNEDSFPFTDGNAFQHSQFPDADTAYNQDFDGDGVNNALEAYYGADPTNPLSKPLDTDGDGWPDAAEREFGSDPFIQSSYPPAGTHQSGEFTTEPNWFPDPDHVNYPAGGGSAGSGGGGALGPGGGGGSSGGGSSEIPYPVGDPDSSEGTAPDSQSDSTPNDADPNNLTAQDVANAIQGSTGSISDAVADGVFRGTQHLDAEFADAIYDSRQVIQEAVKRGVSEAIAETLGGLGAGDSGPGDFGDGVGGSLSADPLGSVGGTLGGFAPSSADSVSLSIPFSAITGAGLSDVQWDFARAEFATTIALVRALLLSFAAMAFIMATIKTVGGLL